MGLLSKAFSLCHRLQADLVIGDKSEWSSYLQDSGISPDAYRDWKLQSVDGFSPFTYSDSASPSETTLNSTYSFSRVRVVAHGHCKQHEELINDVAKRKL